MESEVIFDEIKIIIENEKRRKKKELKKQLKELNLLLYDADLIRAEKEERRNRIVNWKSQTNLHPLPKHINFQKPNWLRTRSNPKLR